MTFVLIHGGGSSSRFWDRLIPLLEAPALAVDLPGRHGVSGDLATITVLDEARAVVSAIERDLAGGDAAEDERLVLVAHSSGGLVVPDVVSLLGGRVDHIVLNAALVPPEGGCGLDCMKPSHSEGLRFAVEQAERDGTVITLPGAPADPEQFRSAYGGDPLDDESLAFLVDPDRCVPDGVHHYFQPVRWSLAAGVPVTYIVNDRDRPVRPAMQEQMIGWLPDAPTVVHLDGGHVPAVTDPAAVAAILNALA